MSNMSNMSNTNKAETKNMKIVVITEQWVLIGEAEALEKDLRLTNAAVIRVWGTTKGLGEIALNGPTKETIFDPCGSVEVANHSIIFTIDVPPENAAKVSAALAKAK